MSTIYYWQKLAFLKHGKYNSLEKNLKKYTSFEEQKLQGILGNFFGEFCLQLSFIYKTMFQNFNLFCSGDKRLLSEFLRKLGWFEGHNEHFLKYLGKKLRFQKTETQFCRWKSTDNNDSNVFLSLENPCTFLLARDLRTHL